jgi:hypothetical protein
MFVTEHADVRVQLSKAITKAKTKPEHWFLLKNRPEDRSTDPFRRIFANE